MAIDHCDCYKAINHMKLFSSSRFYLFPFHAMGNFILNTIKESNVAIY